MQSSCRAGPWAIQFYPRFEMHRHQVLGHYRQTFGQGIQLSRRELCTGQRLQYY